MKHIKQVGFFIIGFLTAVVIFLSINTVWAANILQTIYVDFEPIKIYIDGQEKNPPDDMKLFRYNGRTYAALRYIGEAFGKQVEWDDETRSVIITEPKPVSIKCPILMYHTSSENKPGMLYGLYIKPSEFEKQIKYLTENNYTFCTFDDWNNLHNIEKPVFITFDDGYTENYTEIFPILQKYNAKITIFLTVNPNPIRLTTEMIQEMSDSGLVKFESHTLTHATLTDISSDDERLADELKNSKIKIEEITGKTVVALAYPKGEFDKKVKEKAKEFYQFGISAKYGHHITDMDDFEIRRIGVGRDHSINDFIKFLED